MILTTVKTGAGDTLLDPAAAHLFDVIGAVEPITTNRQVGADARLSIHRAEGLRHLPVVVVTVSVRRPAVVVVRLRHRLAHEPPRRRWRCLGLELVHDLIAVARAMMGLCRPVESVRSRRPEVKGVAVEKIDTGHHLRILEAMLMIKRAKNLSPHAKATVAAVIAAVAAVIAAVIAAVAVTAEPGVVQRLGAAVPHIVVVPVGAEAVVIAAHAPAPVLSHLPAETTGLVAGIVLIVTAMSVATGPGLRLKRNRWKCV